MPTMRVAFVLLGLPAAATARDDEALARALAAIEVESIVADLRVVAGDASAGRETPSAGQRSVARYLRDRVQRLGWKPGARDGWFMEYPLVRRSLDEAGCRARAEHDGRALDLAFGVDYACMPEEIANVDAKGDVLFVGKATVEEIAALGAAPKGCWALLTDPESVRPETEAALQRAGAVGLLVTARLVNLGGDLTARKVFDVYRGLMQRERVAWPRGEEALPRVLLPDATIDRLLALAERPKPERGERLALRFAETRRPRLDETVAAENVVAYWPGSDPELAQQVVLLSAHYDHLGLAQDGAVMNGADDNGSGTVALLALADALAAHGPLPCSVMAIWVSGEERGLWGSRAFAQSPWFPDGGAAAANVNLDMVGRNAWNELHVTPFAEGHVAWNGAARLARAIAPQEGFAKLVSADELFDRSDHAEFRKLGIPVLFLTSGLHADYHAPTDDVEKVDGDKIRRVARLVVRLLAESAEEPAELLR